MDKSDSRPSQALGWKLTHIGKVTDGLALRDLFNSAHSAEVRALEEMLNVSGC